MSFNIFDSATKNNIRVGYIDPERGYIATNSIYEANLYASKNPGATFILETRDRVRYLSINEVNRLGPEDITPDQVACQDGIKGLRPAETPSYPSGNQPLTVGGDTSTPITVGGNGGTPVTSGGNGGRKVTAGGRSVTTGAGNVLKVGGSGGTPVFFGGTGGELVFVGNDILTVNGTEVRVGSQGGIPVKFGGSGGTRITTDGTDQCEGKIYISGGGGVGAYAVPIFGTDGSLLSAIVTEGGFGYKSPPQSRVIDTCKRGVGAVLKTFVGTASTRTEYYDQEDDFEVYNLTPPGGALPGYGDRFGVDGENLGEWDPNLFATLSQSPIGLQIRDYQNFLKNVGITPFWHTRKEDPLRVVFRENTKEVKNDVQHWAWGGKTVVTTEPGKSQPPAKKDQFEELEFEVYSQGGNNPERELQFSFVSEDGKHNFQFRAPEFKDDRKTKVKKKVKRNTVYRVTASGKYKGKGVEQGLVSDFGRKPKEIKGSNKKGTVIFADFVKSSNDNDDLQIRATQGQFTAVRSPEKPDGHSTYELTYKFGSNKDFKPEPKKPEPQKKVTRVIEDSFMNRYAISPVPASDVPGSDFAGRVCTFVWEENFPYSGDYKFRGMADNIGRIFLDNELVLEERKFRGDPTKVVSRYIQEGVHEIKVELFNVPIKIKSEPKTGQGQQGGRVPVKFDVYGQGNKSTQLITYVFTSEDGKDSFTFRPGKTSGGKYSYSRTESVLPNTNYRVKAATSGGRDSGEYEYPITYEDLHPSNQPNRGRGARGGIRVENNGKRIELKDGKGDDANVKFEIRSTSPGVSAKFSDDGRKLLTKGKGNVSIRLKYDDNPNYAGEAVRSITIGGVIWRKERKHKGEETKTLSLTRSKKSSLTLEQGCLKRGSFTKGGKGIESSRNSDVIFADIVESSNDNDDMQIRCGTGEFTPSNQRKTPKGRSTYDLTFKVDVDPESGFKTRESFEGITYSGPELFAFKHPAWSDFMNNASISPFLPPLDRENPDIVGVTNYKWSNVKFPENGRYEIKFQADNIAKLLINGVEVQEVKSFRGEPRLRYVELSRGTYDVEVILTNVPTNRNIFNNNPSGFALRITKDITIISSESPPWTRNPVGASAVIIPPPCPKVIEGTGIVDRIEVLEPGNGYPRSTGGSGGSDGIPVTLKLVDIIPTAPGIGYRPEDRIIVDVPGRPPIELIPTLNDFGQVTGVPIAQTPAIPQAPPQTDDSISGFDIIPNTDAQILQVTDLPGQIGVPDDTGVLIPLVKGGGRIAPGATGTQVPAPGPFYGFTEYPNIYPTSNTGLGFRGRPVFEVVVVPDKVLSDDSVLQVVDIPGIRKTGYVNGKPYYGQVFAKDGFLYAGISQTIGELIPVYATLEASILNRQTIQPSAILRTGSETSDDNPLLK